MEYESKRESDLHNLYSGFESKMFKFREVDTKMKVILLTAVLVSTMRN